MQTLQGAGPQTVFEDDDLLVLDKPGGMACHSAQRPEQQALATWVRQRGVMPRFVNRLDRETSGLILIGKNERAAKILGKAVLRREIEKEYLAICWGELRQDSGVVDQPVGLAKDSVVYTKRVVDRAAGKASMTEFSFEQRLHGFTVVRLWPRTGRTHQLRVHMVWLGHSIVGDKIYGPDERLYLQFIKEGVTGEMLGKLLLPRHALHAARLSLLHPVTRQPCEFEAPLPDDMQTFMAEHE